MKKILYNPYWEENLILNQVDLLQYQWVSGFNLENSSNVYLNKFIENLDNLIINSTIRFTPSSINQVLKDGFVFKQGHFLQIGKSSIYPIQFSIRQMIIEDLRKEKKIKLLSSSEDNLLDFMKTLTNKDYERELVFELTNRFDKLIIENRLESEIDLDFVKQIYSSTNKPLDLIKFVFFTMSRNETLKKTNLFRLIYDYLNDSKLDRLYLYLKK